MAFEIMLSENDLRKMPPDLRDRLLKWYFDHGASAPGSPQSPASGPINSTGSVSLPPQREASGRVSFPEFVRTGLLAPGTEIKCKTLKRQRRSGAVPYIAAGKVLEDGSVAYNGQHYIVPSKLAVAVVNANGGETRALNGYDYLFVRVSNKLLPLQALRESFLNQHT